jgi:hypothetical protein
MRCARGLTRTDEFLGARLSTSLEPDTGVAIALIRNRFSPDFTAIARLDDIVVKAYPRPANPRVRKP